MSRSIRFTGMPAAEAKALREGFPDAYGNLPERAVSDGGGNPCRHCLNMIEKGAMMLIAAHKPFEGLHAYTETGPIFLHADDCPTPPGDDALPSVFDSPSYILRGYTADERIAYGTGGVIARNTITGRAQAILKDSSIAFVHIRSASNNCWQGRVERA